MNPVCGLTDCLTKPLRFDYVDQKKKYPAMQFFMFIILVGWGFIKNYCNVLKCCKGQLEFKPMNHHILQF